MATTTENLGLTLPAGTDRAEISVLNENFQTLDTFAGQATDDIQQAQETANAAAPQASTYTKDEVDAAIEEAIEHGGGGTTDYTDLTNKPSINGVVLTGNKTTSDLGIEENVQADWDEADTTAPSYIKNKPNIPSGVVVDTTYDGTSVNAQAGTAVAQAISTKVDKETGKGLSTNDFTNADKAKLDGIESGAEANVQADWTQTDTTADDYIKNKPTIPSPVTVDQTYSAASANAQSGVAVAQAISTKVDKETGKGLSTNDFTNTDKANLETALTKANSAAPQSTTYTKTEVDTSQAAQDTRLDWMERNIETIRVMMDAVLYGYRVNKNDSNPETRVSYMYDAIGMTPARMNYTTGGTFDYGSWANAWFITGNKPVALKFDGTVDYELDPDDYSKKADGTASDVSDSSYQGNFMASMPTVYVKRWSDGSYDYYAFSNKQITPDFYADAHDAGDGTINPYIYLPMFKGTIVDGKMRSIAGVTPQGETSGSEEKTAAEACGSGWQLWDWSKHELISDLLTLISRSTNSQAAFGQGDTNTYNASDTTTYGKLTTGTSGAGQFWGASDDVHHVKVFHIEDFWGNRWDRCLGLNLVNNKYVYKLVRPYALDTDSSYTSSGLTAPSEGWQKSQNVGGFGTLPKTVGGSNNTYECDYFYRTESGVRLGLFGGNCSADVSCGSRCLYLRSASNIRTWSAGGSPCFSPMPNE